MKKYDLAIVGSGSGLMVLEAALSMGLECAMVEKSKFGGTCLTKGCIPSKMLVYPADLIREAQDAGRVGLAFAKPEVDWGVVAGRMWNQINHSDAIARNLREVPGLDVYEGAGEFTGPRAMRVTYPDGRPPEEFEADKFVLAPGARTLVPPIEGLEAAGYVTAERFFGDLFPEKPWDSLIIVGGGAIGAEFAHIFSAFGTRVTLVEMKPRILPAEEEEISAFVEAQFRERGIELMTGARVLSAAPGDGAKSVEVEDASGARTLSAQEIFIASGVRSNGDLLRLDLTGVATDSRGWILTNEFLETSQPGVYAIGDINGKYQFRHKANYEASILIHNLFGEGERKKASYHSVPWAVFTWPQVAHVGMTEREAKAAGLAIGVATNRYSSIAAGIAMGYSANARDNGFVKIILTREMKIVGVHIAGPYAAMLVQPFVYLINAGCPCRELGVKDGDGSDLVRKIRAACPQIGSVKPVNDSMVIHPSMNELAAWAIDEVRWLN